MDEFSFFSEFGFILLSITTVLIKKHSRFHIYTMNLIPFKLSLTADQECPPYKKDHKILHYNFKEHFPAIGLNTAWSTVEPLVRQAIEKYIIPYICKETIELVLDDYHSETELDEIQKEFLQIYQDTVAYYTMHHGFPTLNTMISDMGIQEQDNQKSMPVSLWRYKNTRGYISNFADCMLDRLIAFILKLDDDESIKISFINNCNVKFNCFFPDLESFETYVDIKGSFRTFQAIMPHLNKSMRGCLKGILCSYLESLCENATKSTINDEEKSLIENIRPLLAYTTMVEAIPHLRVAIEGNGIMMISSNDGIDIKQSAHKEMIHTLIFKYQEDANNALRSLKSFLYKNADDYPEWKDTECYVEPSGFNCGPLSNSNGAVIL